MKLCLILATLSISTSVFAISPSVEPLERKDEFGLPLLQPQRMHIVPVTDSINDPYSAQNTAKAMMDTQAYVAVSLAQKLHALNAFHFSIKSPELKKKARGLKLFAEPSPEKDVTGIAFLTEETTCRLGEVGNSADLNADEVTEAPTALVEFFLAALADNEIIAAELKPFQISILNLSINFLENNDVSLSGEFIINPAFLKKTDLNGVDDPDSNALTDPFTFQNRYVVILNELYRYIQKGNELPKDLQVLLPPSVKLAPSK